MADGPADPAAGSADSSSSVSSNTSIMIQQMQDAYTEFFRYKLVDLVVAELLPFNIFSDFAFDDLRLIFEPNSKLSEEEFTDRVAVFASVKNLPLNNFCGPAFRKFCTSFNPKAPVFTTTTLRRSIKKLYLECQKGLIVSLADAKHNVSLYVDVWRDCSAHWHCRSYVSVCCFWIDDYGLMQRRLLAFEVFEKPQHISQMILPSVLEKYNLASKVFSVSLNGEDSNIVDVEDVKLTCINPVVVGNIFSFRYICHVLNVCARDVLQNLELQLKPVMKDLQYFRYNSQVLRQWAKFCQANGKRPVGFGQANPTRWDSTYLMLQKSVDYKELLCTFFTQNVDGIHLNPSQWPVCEKICDVLTKFHHAVSLLSHVYDPKPHMMLFHCGEISKVLVKYLDDDDLKDIVGAMMDRLRKYLLNFPVINLAALVLCPWVKLDGLKDKLAVYYDGLLPVRDEHSPDPTLVVNDVKQYLSSLYDEYKSRYGVPQVTKPETGSDPEDDGYPDQELENYLKTTFDCVCEDDTASNDVLQWWSKRTRNFPILSRMVKEVFACFTSTTSPDQVFEVGGNILSEWESQMDLGSLEARLCLGDWVKAEKRSQDVCILDYDDDDEGLQSDDEGERQTQMCLDPLEARMCLGDWIRAEERSQDVRISDDEYDDDENDDEENDIDLQSD